MVLTDLKKLKLIAIVLTMSLVFTSLPGFLWGDKEVLVAESLTNVSITLPTTVKCNEIFNGAVVIDQVDSLNACNYDILFDSSLLEVLDVTQGNINAQDIPVGNWQIMDAGRIRIIQDLPGVSTVSGSGTLVNLTIRAKGLAGTTASVNLENGIISNANAEEISASWTGASATIIDWASGLKICTETLPDAPADKFYRTTLEAAGGIPPYQWSIEGNLPPGLSLENETGIISGIPSLGGNYSFTTIVNDSGGNVAKVILNISTGAVLDINLVAPDSMRPFRNYLIDLQYANNSSYVMESPLLVISSPSQAPLRLNTEQAFTTKPLQLLAINFHGQADQLPAHYSHNMQVETQAIATGPIDYSVGVVQADNTPINWEEVLNSLSPFLEPGGRNAVIDNLKEQMGSTTADYIQTIRRNASYLSQMDRYVYDVDKLLAMELRQAVAPYIKSNLSEATDVTFNTPGIPLEFTRVYPQALDQRYYQGPLGWGWRHTYDISCSQLNDGSVLLRAPFYQGVFLLNSDGTFQSSNIQYQLKKDNGLLELQTKAGTKYSFDANGLVSQITEQNGNHIDLIYAATGRLSEIVHSNGQKYKLQYNAQGLISALTDNFGKTSSYTYDQTGHLIQVKMPDGRQTSYTYNMEQNSRSLHSLVKTTYLDNSIKILSYDSRGRLAAEQLGNDAIPTRIEYPDTAVCLITDPTGAVTKFCLDENGQIIEKADPVGEVSQLKYSPDGNLINVKGPEGSTVGIEYDPEGNITGLIDPLGQITSMIYKDNQLISMQDPKLNKTSLSYDAMGNLEKIISPDGTWEAYLYDHEGKMITYTDRKGQTESIQYDDKGLVTRRDFSDGSWISYSYDASGNLTLVEDQNGKIQMQYNQRNLLTRITYPNGSFFNYTFDSAGRCIGRMDHSGYSLQYLYNSAGKLQAVKDGKGRTIVTYEYDTIGRMTKETKGNGVYTVYGYDIKGQLTSLQNFSSSGELLSKFEYGYDSTGRKISMTTLEGMTQYKYDARGMLTEVIYPDGRRNGYAYDAAGNRRAASEGSATRQYVTNNMNQYVAAGDTTYTHDANGNLISKISGGKTTTYQYDSQNRLIRMETAGDIWEYRYDALGNQTVVIHNGDERRFLADPINDMGMAAEYDSEGTLVSQYIKGAGVAARVDTTGTPAYYTFDGSGNTSEMTAANGEILNQYDYDPFGELKNKDEQMQNPLQLQGKYGVQTEKNGLSYTPSGFYDSQNARLISTGSWDLPRPAFTGNSYAYNDSATSVNSSYEDEAMAYINEYEQYRRNILRSATELVIAGSSLAYDLPIDEKGFSLTGFIQLGAGTVGTIILVGGGPVTWGLALVVGSAVWSAVDFYNTVDKVMARAGVIRSWDPNEKTGPENNIYPGQTISYKIFYENDPEGYPKTDNLTSTSVDLKVQINEVGRAYYVVLTSEDDPPDQNQVKAGEDSSGTPFAIKGDFDVAAYTDKTWRINDLSPETEYIIYVVAEDSFSNLTEVKTLSIMTPAQAVEAAQAFQAFSLMDSEAPTQTTIELSAGNANYEQAVKSNDDSGSFAIMAETPDTTPPEFPTGSTAPVQELTVTDDLDAALDWSSFQPTGFAFGGHVYPITQTGNSYSTRVTVPDYRADINKDWWVDVKITLDLTSGQAKWTFKTTDPETDEPPVDALAGFLPVNDKELANGEGYVTFTIKVRENAAVGTNVDNEAKIYFDYNPAIITEKVSNIIVEPPQPVVKIPHITIDSASLDFGSIIENETSEQNIVLYNGGSSKLSINSLALPLEPFYVLDYTDVNPYAVLEPGSSTVVTVKFAPTTVGDFYDVIIVKSNDPDEGEVNIPLTGRGITAATPQLSILPAVVGFDTVTINTEAYQDIIATNTGNSNLEIGTVSLAGTDTVFRVMNDGFSGKTLVPGSSVTLRLGFSPAEEQAYSNSLNIPTNDPQNEQKQLELSGTGVPPTPDICSSKNQILFGNVIVGQGLERIVTISNAGGADLQIGDVSIAETESPFSLVVEKDNLSAVTLPPGEAATLSILFAPEQAGTYNATLIIPSNDPDQNQLSISLSGQGQLTTSVQGIIVTGQDGITTIQVQDTLQMLAEVLPGSATDKTISWSITGQEGTATIDENGLLKALAPGVIEVKAEAEDGSGVAGYREITVEEADPLINDECFIATAAFGSKFTRPVVMLRSFRDQYLLTNAWGIAFVKCYYQHSPPVAALIAGNQSLKMLVRVLLVPIIAMVYMIYHPMLIIGLLILLVAIFAQRLRRRYISTDP